MSSDLKINDFQRRSSHTIQCKIRMELGECGKAEEYLTKCDCEFMTLLIIFMKSSREKRLYEMSDEEDDMKENIP